MKCLDYSSNAEFMQQFVRIVGNGEILNVGEEKYWGIFGQILIKVDGTHGRGIWRLALFCIYGAPELPWPNIYIAKEIYWSVQRTLRSSRYKGCLWNQVININKQQPPTIKDKKYEDHPQEGVQNAPLKSTQSLSASLLLVNQLTGCLWEFCIFAFTHFVLVYFVFMYYIGSEPFSAE